MTLTSPAWVYGPRGTLIGSYNLTPEAAARLEARGFVVTDTAPVSDLTGKRVEYHGSITDSWGDCIVLGAVGRGDETRYILRPVDSILFGGVPLSDLHNVRRQSFTLLD